MNLDEFCLATYALATILEGGADTSVVRNLKPEKHGPFLKTLWVVANVGPKEEQSFSPEIKERLREVHFVLEVGWNTGAVITGQLKEIARSYFSRGLSISPEGRDCFRAIGLGITAGLTIGQGISTYGEIMESPRVTSVSDLAKVFTEPREKIIIDTISIFIETGGHFHDFLLFAVS